MLTVASQTVRSAADLQPVPMTLLRLIPYGESWLRVLAASRGNYAFGDGFDLLAQLQAGLHGDPVMLLRRVQLAAHPGALEGLTLPDAQALVTVELSEQPAANAIRTVQRILGRYHLLTEDDFKAEGTSEFLTELGVQDEVLMQSQSLGDRIYLHRLIGDDLLDHKLNLQSQKEAATFAVGRSANMADFADYYRFYMTFITDPLPDPAQGGKRLRAAEALTEALSDVAYELLWTPTLQTVPRLSEMPSLIAQWAERGSFLGFPRLSAALAHIVRYCPVNGATGPYAQQIISARMKKLQAAWMNTVPSASYVSQTGTQRLYDYKLPNASAQLSLAPGGSLTIASYRETAPVVLSSQPMQQP